MRLFIIQTFTFTQFVAPIALWIAGYNNPNGYEIWSVIIYCFITVKCYYLFYLSLINLLAQEILEEDEAYNRLWAERIRKHFN